MGHADGLHFNEERQVMDNNIQCERIAAANLDRTLVRRKVRSGRIIVLMAMLLLSCGLQARTSDGTFTPADIGCNSHLHWCWLSYFDDFTNYRFATFDGDWSPIIFLPFLPNKDTKFEVKSNATWPSSIYYRDVGQVLLRFSFGKYSIYTDLTLRTNDQYVFTNSNDYVHYPSWYISGQSVKYLTPNDSSGHIPDAPRLIVYQTSNGNWTRNVYLSNNAVEDQLVIIHSDSQYKVDVFASSLNVGTVSQGETVAYKYIGHTWTRVNVTQECDFVTAICSVSN
jgi:hypothetical protein